MTKLKTSLIITVIQTIAKKKNRKDRLELEPTQEVVVMQTKQQVVLFYSKRKTKTLEVSFPERNIAITEIQSQ
jgi:hypothetical protein